MINACTFFTSDFSSVSSRSFRLVAAAAIEATEAAAMEVVLLLMLLLAMEVVPAMLLMASGVEQWMLEDVEEAKSCEQAS